jgi:hypothetical protein
MSEDEETPTHDKAASGEPLDLRWKLKAALKKEFKATLVSDTSLTEAQCAALSEAVDSTEVSAASLLKSLSAED